MQLGCNLLWVYLQKIFNNRRLHKEYSDMSNKVFPFLALAVCLLLSCKSHHEAHDDHEHEAGHSHDITETTGSETADNHEEEHNPDEIILSPEKAKSAGIEVEVVEPSEFHSVLKCSGKVLTANGDETTVVAPAAGIASVKKSFTEGMPVSKGSSILSISSAQLPEGDLTKRTALAYRQAKTEFERAEKLIEDKLITEKEYLAAKTDYERARLAFEAMGSNNVSGGSAVISPATGYIKECLVTDGDYVEVGQPLMRITQNRKLYLRAEVSERDYDMLPTIKSANFKPSYTDKVYNLSDLDGRLIASGQSVSTTGSFVPVTFEFNNVGGIVPGSFAEIYLISGNRDNVISIPVSALTEEQGVYYVYVRVDDEGYLKKEVKLGASDGDRIEVISGLEKGDNLVTKGAIHVKLASASSVIPAHTHNH